jgi:integrase/recombinase XerD
MTRKLGDEFNNTTTMIPSDTDTFLTKHPEDMSVREALFHWMNGKNRNTAEAYYYRLKTLSAKGILSLEGSIADFAKQNLNAVTDAVERVDFWGHSTKANGIAALVAFSAYLSRLTNGKVQKAVPSKEAYKKHNKKVKSEALTKGELSALFKALAQISERAALIAIVTFCGGRRIGEVLALRVQDIRWDTSEIVFVQTKSGFMDDQYLVTMPESVMKRLRAYLAGREEGFVFATKSGRPVNRWQVSTDLLVASGMAGITKQVTPHSMRTSAITLWSQEKFQPHEIMKVTGHATVQQVVAYDKTSQSDNLSRKCKFDDIGVENMGNAK